MRRHNFVQIDTTNFTGNWPGYIYNNEWLLQ